MRNAGAMFTTYNPYSGGYISMEHKKQIRSFGHCSNFFRNAAMAYYTF